MLFNRLACKIKEYDDSSAGSKFINVPSFYLLGTQVIQNDFIRFKFTCNHKSKDYDGELTIDILRSFLERKGLDVEKCIKNINIAVEYENGSWTALKSITEYIEFITDDNFCLRNGKWCYFNDAFIDGILQEANQSEG